MSLLAGHLGMGLLFALPAWILWDGRVSAVFVAFVVSTSKLPDLDITLGNLGFPVKHHGVVHTVTFVVAFSVVAAVLTVAVLRPLLRRWWLETEDETVPTGTLFLFTVGGFTLGGISHLVADVMAADPVEPVEPLWPFIEEPVELGLFYYASPWMNLGLLLVAVALHLVLFSLDAVPLETRYRRWDV